MEANKKVLFSHFQILQSRGFSLFFLLIRVNYAFIIQINYVTSTIYLEPSRIEKAIDTEHKSVVYQGLSREGNGKQFNGHGASFWGDKMFWS